MKSEAAQKDEAIYKEAVDLFRRERRVSIPLLQRRLMIGYVRAVQIVERMEAEKIVRSGRGDEPIRVLA